MAVAVLTVYGLSKSYNIYPIFEDVSFTLNGGERVALVGPNGVGKSTLLKVLAGLEKPSTGAVVKAKGVRLVYLPQEAASSFASEADLSFAPDETLHNSMLDASGPVRALQQQLSELEGRMAGTAGGDWDALMSEYEAVTHRFEMAGGYDLEHRIEEVLQGLGFKPEQYTQPLNTMSGGQRTRAALARALLSNPDVLLLDEPTNHLDIAAIEWLENFLLNWKGTLLAIAHDRRFLNKVTNRTLDMEFTKHEQGIFRSKSGTAREAWEKESFSRLQDYPAPYDRYLELKAERYELLMAQYEAQQETMKKTEEFIRRYKNSQKSRQAMGRQKRLFRMEKLERPTEKGQLRLSLRAHVRSGRSVFEAEDLEIGYPPRDGAGGPVVIAHCPDLEIERGERVALIGPNGAGKTTLLKTIMGALQPLRGHLELGHNVRFGYYSQTHEGLNGANSVLEEVRSVRNMTEQHAREVLALMLFSGDNIEKRVADLSGGERSRVALTKLMLTDANFLILDEPTNHLDLDAQEALTDVLGGYDGTILFVSHDRAFIDDLATQVWLLDGGTLASYDGNYSEYIAEKARREEPATAAVQAPANGGRQTTGSNGGHPAKEVREASKSVQRQDRAQERERTRLHKRKQAAEARISELEETLNRVSDDLTAATERRDLEAIVKLGTRYTELEEALEQAYAEWQRVEEETTV
ncbi:MAG TPA: ABC-F family ATP-binding cassette domain-containing protein [Chloroflexia bacterium]|jgi:ATP-binding cassette subfamily F protein 3